MIRTWTVAPPEPKRHIVHIAMLDMDLFAAEAVAAADHIYGIQVRGPDVILEPPGITSHMSLMESTPYVVTFSDGQTARCGHNTLINALAALGQTWIWEEGS